MYFWYHRSRDTGKINEKGMKYLVKTCKNKIYLSNKVHFRKTDDFHCVQSVQIRKFFWFVLNPNTGKYGPEKTPYLDKFHAVFNKPKSIYILQVKCRVPHGSILGPLLF